MATARYDLPSKNADYNLRAVERADNLNWQATDTEGVAVKLLESVELQHHRLTMLIRFSAGSRYDLIQHAGGEEFLVLSGNLHDSMGQYGSGTYVRNPPGRVNWVASEKGCLLFAKLGEFASTDDQHRVISTNDETAWLPGPVAGTEALALHVHGAGNILLLRWTEDTAFKPGLDPQGEELYVINGRLRDKFGEYGPGCWVRNPIPAWQTWAARQGTLVYYKNGHFPTTASNNPGGNE